MTSDDEITPPDESAAPGRLARWRSALATHPLRVMLSAGVVGAVAIAATAVLTGVGDSSGRVGVTKIGVGDRVAQDAFTRSVTGDCLQWPEGQPGSPSKVDCGEPHRFEVAAAVDGAVLPGGEFSPTAKWPGPDRFATIRVEQCPVLISGYLKGRFDPQGRFVPNLMYPSEAQWDRGQRDLRCGLVEKGTGGTAMEVTGRVADLDQSQSWAPGTCIGIDPATRQPTFPVNCAEPHAFQTTGIIDMSARFGARTSGRPWPGIDEQNKFLTPICPVQAHRFMGGKREFEKTTLNVQWSTVSEIGWLAGSRKAVCYIGLPFKGGFATLVGDARKQLLINGKIPTPPPPAPPGRALPTPVPMPGGIAPNPAEVPAPVG
ncbi:septum formation family protein [Gordonia sp. X0973]|uniref:septum formation family protein n=1 Tax=Gordonia sp. X0973 TaxID=2742602 RepID=UPI000F528BA3|nr:septum formation family protein [Gordonia sp. X0973]QKT05843.1 septum formation family protein [Gordonia sp. X0973]